MNGIIDDFKLALRSLLGMRLITVLAVITLALGIGANTAIFSVINGLLLQPLPYAGGERLVQVFNTYPSTGLDYAGNSIPDYLDRREADALEDLALYTGMSFNLATSGTPERIVGLKTTPSLFSTLQASPAMGRTFAAAESEIGQDKVAILSHSLWQQRFAGDPQVIASEVRMNGESYRIIGVMPADFHFPNQETQLWVPFAFTPQQRSDDERGNEFSESIGRLRSGATVAQLNAQMDAMIARLAERIAGLDDPRAAGYAAFLRSGGFVGRARSLREQWVGDLKPTLFLLQAVVFFVLLIACANVANLMLTRVFARHKELSVRSAMGASQARISRQLFGEAALLSLAGAVAGIVLAFIGLTLLDQFGLNQSRLSSQVNIDGTVLLATLLLAMLTALACGLFPALLFRHGKVFEALKEGGRSQGGGRMARLTRNTLVVVQIFLAVTLLVGAGLMMRSYAEAQSQKVGFERDGRLTMRLSLPATKYPEPEDQAAFYDRALQQLRAIPGVSEAAYVSNLPFGQSNWTASYGIEGRERSPGDPSPHGYGRMIDESFFAAMEIPLLQGRGFTLADTRSSQPVVVVDELLAEKYFPAGDAIGARICRNCNSAEQTWWTIVGVVGSIKNINLTDTLTKESYYFSFRQFTYDQGFFVLKSSLPSGGLVKPLREAIQSVDPEQPVYDIKTMDERIRISLQGREAPMVLLGVFAALALLLSAIGIYGVLSFAVAQRTGEFGVRRAMGASYRDIVALVLSQAGRTVLLGLALGLIGAVVLTRFMQSQLFGVTSGDPLTLLIVIITLGLVALPACWLPARRAATIEPMQALRNE